jgi:hypothetical protein
MPPMPGRHGHRRQLQAQQRAAHLGQLHLEPGAREYSPWPLWHGRQVSQCMTKVRDYEPLHGARRRGLSYTRCRPKEHVVP